MSQALSDTPPTRLLSRRLSDVYLRFSKLWSYTTRGARSMREIDIRIRRTELEHNYCLVLTSNSVEKRAVNAVLSSRLKANVGQRTSGAYLGLLEGSLVLHISGESGVSKDRSVGRIANAFLRDTTMPPPRAVLLVGFCWRNPSRTPAETLLISNEVWCANLQHATEGELRPRGNWQRSPVPIDQLQVQRLTSDLTAASVQMQMGSVASAETLYADDALREQLVRGHPELLGGEMEAFAFVSHDFPWLVVKAGSDAGGSDFDRDRQEAAAALAARSLGPLLSATDTDGIFSAEDRRRSANVRDLLEGDTVEFDVRNHRIEDLNDVLDRHLGAQLEIRLKRYAAPDAYGPEFSRRCVDTLLELVQNAVRHGRANHVSIVFQPGQILFKDDGQKFDPRHLVNGGRGGSRAVKSLLQYEATGAVRLSVSDVQQGNAYFLELPRALTLLEEARQECSIRVRDGVIGVPLGRPVIFEFAPDCKTLYLDTTTIRMSSRKYVLSEEIKRLVDEGKTIYVGCASDDDVLFFKDELRQFIGFQVVIFRDPALPATSEEHF
jgi:hypothetical protein